MATLPETLQSLPDPAVRVEGADQPASLDALQDRLGYRFERPALLRVALTLGSWANEHPDAGWPSNACLEFFGDAVLDLLVADAVWLRFPTLAEGELTRLRAMLVSERSLTALARSMELGDYLYLGRGDRKRGAREHAGTLADAVEAVLGAIFLDARAAGHAPLQIVGAVFSHLFADQLAALRPEQGIDPKSRLQHWAQGQYRITPTYVKLSDRPVAGETRWRARVELHFADGRVEVLGEGEGRSLKRAEREAASAALVAVGLDEAELGE